MKRTAKLFVALIVVTGLASCNLWREPQTSSVTPVATLGIPTTTPTRTPTPDPSPTSSPTLAPTALPTTIPEITVTLGEALALEHAGFSYQPVVGYQKTYRPGIAVLSSDDEEIFLAIGGGLIPEEITVEEGLEGFLRAVAATMEDFTTAEPFPTVVGGVDGLAVEVQGHLYGNEIQGRITYAILNNLQFFCAFGNAPEERWQAEGVVVFEALTDSVSFFDPTPIENLCPVTADPNYGYSKDSPIRVGEGDVFLGPSLERAYLDQLRGPKGEMIEYERSGSLTHGDTILDAYQITYNDSSVILYFDMYQLEPFKVPVGFTCASEP